jgi:hypothetical protein
MTIEQDLEYISGVLSDIEVMDLPWNELEIVSISLDWDAAVGRLRRMPQILDRDESDYLSDIKVRIRAQKVKMDGLGIYYPNFIDI